MAWYECIFRGSGGSSGFPSALQEKLDALETDKYLVCSLNQGDDAADQVYQWNTMSLDNTSRSLRSGNYMRYAIIFDTDKISYRNLNVTMSNDTGHTFLFFLRDGNMLGGKGMDIGDMSTYKYLVISSYRDASSGAASIRTYGTN